MASPQVEDGALQIANELQSAIMRFEFTALERRVLDAVMRFTYGAGKTRAEITPEDIRLMVEGRKRVRTDRIEQVLVKLTQQKVLTAQSWNDGLLLGIQKNFDIWVEVLPKVDKMSTTLRDIDINNNSNPIKVLDKKSIPERLVAYSQRKSRLQHSITTWRTERSYAKKVYTQALTLTNDPKLALLAIQDYIDTNDWMRANVARQFAYMSSRFEQWFSSIPRKTREQLEDEQFTGRRYRWNAGLKQWEIAS